MPEGLQGQRTRIVLAGVGLRQVHDPMRQIGDGAGGFRQVGGVRQPEPQVRGQPVDDGPGDRAAVVLGGRQQVGRDRLDLAEVVALPAHPVPQLGVGAPGLLRGGGPLGLDPGHRPVQPDQRLERLRLQPGSGPDRRDVQRLERGRALGLLQFDLQRGPAAGRGHRQQVRQAAVQGRGQGGQQRQLRLPFAVLDQRQRGRADRRRGRDLVQRQSGGAPDVPEPPPDRQRVGSGAGVGVQRGEVRMPGTVADVGARRVGTRLDAR